MLSKKVINAEEVNIDNLFYFYKTEIEVKMQDNILSSLFKINNLNLVSLKYSLFQALLDVETEETIKIVINVPLNYNKEFSEELDFLLKNRGFDLLQALRTLETIFKEDSITKDTGLESYLSTISLMRFPKCENIQSFDQFFLSFHFEEM